MTRVHQARLVFRRCRASDSSWTRIRVHEALPLGRTVLLIAVVLRMPRCRSFEATAMDLGRLLDTFLVEGVRWRRSF